MSADQPFPEDPLNQEERKAILQLEAVYSGQAKLAVNRFAETLGLDDAAKKALIGGVALRLEDLDFEARRDVRDKFSELTTALGTNATQASVAVVSIEEAPDSGNSELPDAIEQKQPAADTEPDIRAVAAVPSAEPDARPATPIAPDETAATLTEAPAAETSSEAPPTLTPVQKSWFGSFLQPTELAKVEQMTPFQRENFADKLADFYQGLSITRVDKPVRAAQLAAFINGSSHKDIAKQFGVSEASIKYGLRKVIDSVHKRVDYDEIANLIDTSTHLSELPKAQGKEYEGSAEVSPVAIEKPLNPFTPHQKAWLQVIYDKPAISRIEALPLYQRLEYTTKLGTRYTQLKIRGMDSEFKKKRAEQLVAFMGGKSYSEIAALTGNSPDNIRPALLRMAVSIKQLMSVEELDSLIPNPKKPAESEVPDGEAVAEGSSEITVELPLSKDQINWYKKVFQREGDLEKIADLNSEQLNFLAERLSRRLNSYIIKKEKPVRTQRRIEEMKRLIKGETYEQIAEAVSLPVADVKDHMHRSASSLYRNTREIDLRKLLLDAKNYTGKDE